MNQQLICDRIDSTEFKTWIPFIKLSLADIPGAGGDCRGIAAVYAMRDARTGDILKYGKSKEFRGRMYGNYIGGAGGNTTSRIHTELFGDHRMIDHVEISWIVTEDEKVAESMEKYFRSAYKQRMGRRPIWDLKD